MYKKSTIDKIGEQLKTTFVPSKEPKSIILNFPDENNPHGCKCKCSYCNWKSHPLAQGLIYPDSQVLDKYLKNHTGLITISGGGDPLYNLDKNYGKLAPLIDYLYERKLFVRIITRERENFFELKKTYPLLLGSFSIDSFDQLQERDEFIEYSIVLRPEICKEIISSRFKVLAEHRIVFREPLNTGYMISSTVRRLLSAYPKAEFSTEKLCYEAEYLVGDKILTGYDIFD